MADYVVRMTGQDNLSGTIKQVKSELNDLGKTTSKLDQIDKKFEKITQSAAGVKKEMRDLTALGSQLKFDGDYNAAQLLKIAKAAGEAKDSMDDFNAMKKYFADDNRHLNTAIQGMQGLAAAGSVTAGVLGMVGVEQEKVNQAILYCQSALSVLNGLNTIANVLNKDSYVRIAAKVLGLKAEAAATNKATTAQATNTAATKAGTLAQLKLNAAVLANPYVLAAAAVVALGVAIYNLVKKSDELSEAQERAKKIAEEVQGVYEDGTRAYIKNSLELNQLRNSLDNFNGSKEEEKRLVEDLNNKYGNTLGKYKDLDSWKRTLADSSYYYCNLLKHEAILQAANAKAAEAYIKAISGEDAEVNWSIYNNLLAEAERQQKYVDFFRDQLNKTRRSNGDISYSSSGSGRSTRPSRTGGRGSGSTKGDDFEKDSLAYLEKQKSLKEEILKKQNLSEQERENILKEILDLEGRIGLIKYEQAEAEKKLLAERQKGRASVVEGMESPLASIIKKGNDEFMIKPKIDPEAAKEAQERLHALNEKLAEYFNKQKEKSEKTSEAIGDTFSGLRDTLSSMGSMIDQPALNAAGTIAQAIATYILGWSKATAAAAEAGPWGWAAFTLGTAAQLAAIVAQIHSLSGYAEGGIVSGGTQYGDHILARVNAGEMILNQHQQGNLFRAIESGGIGSGSTVMIPDLRIKGSDLYVSFRNYSKSVSKTGKTTGIL